MTIESGSKNRRPLKLEAGLADALDVSRSARPRQVAEAVLELAHAHDLDDDRLPARGAAWVRHLVELIGEHEWRTDDLRDIAGRIAADAVSDTTDDDIEGALKIVVPSERATGAAATTALRRMLPPYCEKLIRALRAIPPTLGDPIPLEPIDDAAENKPGSTPR